MVHEGNIRWFSTPEEITNNYPLRGYLDWGGVEYEIFELRDKNKANPTYWLNRGIVVPSNIESSTYVNYGLEVIKDSEPYRLGNVFDSVFLSTNSYSGIIPPECIIPNKDEVKEYLRDNTNSNLMYKMNFRDEDNNDRYDGSDRNHRIWIDWDHSGRRGIGLGIGSTPDGGAAKVYHSAIPFIERIRVQFAELDWNGSKLNVDLDSSTKRTSHMKWGFGAWFEAGDFDSPENDNKRKRLPFPYSFIKFDVNYHFPFGYYTPEYDPNKSQSDYFDEIMRMIYEHEGDPASSFFSPDTWFNAVLPAIFGGIVMADLAIHHQQYLSPRWIANNPGLGALAFLKYLLDRPLNPMWHIIAWANVRDWMSSILFNENGSRKKLKNESGSLLFNRVWAGIFYRLDLGLHEVDKPAWNASWTWGGLAVAILIGGWSYNKHHWAEFRCMVDATPPDTPPPGEAYNEYPDPIFFGSGY